MIKIDISKAIPKRLGPYLLGIIPGTIFELSLALGDPSLAHKMIDRAMQVYDFKPYVLLILFGATCLLVGQVFYLVSWFAEMLVTYGYGAVSKLVRITLGSDWLYRLFGKLQGIPPKRNIFIRALSRVVRWGREKRFAFHIRPILQCQRMAANQLLNRRYGINASKELSQNAELEWQVWLAVLGKLPPEFRAAALSMRTILGCGLAELAALYISPLLRNRYFITICAVFIAAWCIQSASYALRRHEPARRNITLLASLLVEMEEAEVVTAKGTSTYPKETSLLIDGEGEEG